jgi:sugar phosphate isomerase/epimerase
MPPFRLALATRCLELPLRESLRDAADAGAAGVQLDLRQELPAGALQESGRRDLRNLLDELGLQVSGTTFTLRRALTDEHELDRRIAALKQAMTWSYELHASVLTVRLGQLPTDSQGPPANTLKEVLEDLARHANHAGVVLALTPTLDDPSELERLLREIRTGPIGVDFDPAQYAMAGRDPVAALSALHPHVQHVQLRDGLAEADGGAEMPIGKGAVPWIELLATLGEMEYPGWLTAIRTQGRDRAGDLARGIRHVRRLVLGG